MNLLRLSDGKIPLDCIRVLVSFLDREIPALWRLRVISSVWKDEIERLVWRILRENLSIENLKLLFVLWFHSSIRQLKNQYLFVDVRMDCPIEFKGFKTRIMHFLVKCFMPHSFLVDTVGLTKQFRKTRLRICLDREDYDIGEEGAIQNIHMRQLNKPAVPVLLMLEEILLQSFRKVTVCQLVNEKRTFIPRLPDEVKIVFPGDSHRPPTPHEKIISPSQRTRVIVIPECRICQNGELSQSWEEAEGVHIVACDQNVEYGNLSRHSSEDGVKMEETRKLHELARSIVSGAVSEESFAKLRKGMYEVERKFSKMESRLREEVAKNDIQRYVIFFLISLVLIVAIFLGYR